MISDKAGLEYIAELFLREGIKDIVISPGSRNAPMILTFPEYKEFTIYSIVDERSAGFFALGIALKTHKPVVLNCTSGSALLNYAPALAEAYYQNIPLIVLSADRPEYLIDQGDGQAIRQKNIYSNFIRKSVHLPENPQSDIEIENYQNLILDAISASRFPVLGPVHINMPLDEPIYGVKERRKIRLLDKQIAIKRNSLTDDRQSELDKQWLKASKKMLLIGQMPINSHLNELVDLLSKREDVVVLSETTSNISSSAVIGNIDRVLTQMNDVNEDNLSPDIVISIGGHIVSKKIKSWLRKCTSYIHWHVGLDASARDTFFHLKEHLQVEAADVLSPFLSLQVTDSTYHKDWSLLASKAQKAHALFLKNAIYSDLVVFDMIVKMIPKNEINIHFSNSSPIRYSQLFQIDSNTDVDGNRGVSGIDGSISTALGASLVNKGMTCVISGDLSFFYDNNALWNEYLHANFRIIVINNQGGGIFRFIEGPKQSNHLNYFEATHQRSAKSLAIEAGIDYSSCRNKKDLKLALESFFLPSDAPKLLEIFTPRELNDVVLKEYFSFLKKVK